MKGEQGHDGQRGKQGKDGPPGSSGPKGAKGAPGYAGHTGSDGALVSNERFILYCSVTHEVFIKLLLRIYEYILSDYMNFNYNKTLKLATIIECTNCTEI